MGFRYSCVSRARNSCSSSRFSRSQARKPGVADGHSESGRELHGTPYPFPLSLALASMNRIIANTRISEVADSNYRHFVRQMRREERHPAGHRRPGVIAVAIGRLQPELLASRYIDPKPPFVEAQHAGTLEPCIGFASLHAIHREPRSAGKVLSWNMTVRLHDRTPSARLDVQLGELRSVDAAQARNAWWKPDPRMRRLSSPAVASAESAGNRPGCESAAGHASDLPDELGR